MLQEFVSVAKITFNNQTFATRDAHMVLYDEEIYDVWISILEKQLQVPGRQPTISMFRCLRGLDDSDVKTIQEDLIEGKTFLIKSPEHKDIMDLEERSKNIKRTKVFEKEITMIFQDADPKSKVSSWEECVSTFNISKKMYHSLFHSCLSWLDVKLQHAKATPDFPNVTKGYVRWIVDQKYGVAASATAFPWSIKMVGANLEGIEFLGDDKVGSKLSVGVCILDATHDLIAEGRWSYTHFERVLDGLTNITFEPSQFIFLVFIRHIHIAALERALAAKAGCYEIQVIGMDSLFAMNARSLVQLGDYSFGVVVTFTKQEAFSGISHIRDALSLPFSCITCVEKEKNHMELAKAYMVQRVINDVCIKEDDHVVDILTLGFGAKEALLLQRKVISVVCTNEQSVKVEEDCLAAVGTSLVLKKWAGLVPESKEVIVTDEENEDMDGEGDDSDLMLEDVGSFLKGLSKSG